MISHHGNAEQLVRDVLGAHGATVTGVEVIDLVGRRSDTSPLARVFVSTGHDRTVFRYSLPIEEADLRAAAVRALEPSEAWKSKESHWKRGE